MARGFLLSALIALAENQNDNARRLEQRTNATGVGPVALALSELLKFNFSESANQEPGEVPPEPPNLSFHARH
jgi:hypothetical protein